MSGAVCMRKVGSGVTTLFNAQFINGTGSDIAIQNYIPEVGPQAEASKCFGSSGLSLLAPLANTIAGGSYFRLSASNRGPLWNLPQRGRVFTFNLIQVDSWRLSVRQPLVNSGDDGIEFEYLSGGTLRFRNRGSVVGSSTGNAMTTNTVVTCVDDGTSNVDAFKIYYDGVLKLTSNFSDAGTQTGCGFNNALNTAVDYLTITT